MSFLRRIIDALTRPIRSIFAAPLRLMAAPRRLLGMPLPLRVAVIVELLLILLVIASVVVVFLTEGHAGWEHDIRKIAAIVVVLLVVIPWVFYLLVKLWLEGESSRFPDIDDAWRAGASALEENGLDITSIPLFLLVGAPDERQVKVLMEATDYSWSVRNTPAGPAALHWYGNRDAIYLATTETCRLGELVRCLAGLRDTAVAEAPIPAGPGRPVRTSTVAPLWQARSKP